MASNRNLHAAKAAKNNEFYTRMEDINAELMHYREHFRGKTVYCNCDDPWESNFTRYFREQFGAFGLKGLRTTCYRSRDVNLFSRNDSKRAVHAEWLPDAPETRLLKGDGSFDSPECRDLMWKSDIVVTNPPFSHFSGYMAQLMEWGGKFLVLGPKGAVHYNDIFPYIKDGRVWVGATPMGRDMLFGVPNHYRDYLLEHCKEGSSYRVVNGKVFGRAPAVWFTNMDHSGRHEPIEMSSRYDPDVHPTYDNYPAIEACPVKTIPCDYEGEIGVPDTFLDKYCPEQFEIVGIDSDFVKEGRFYIKGRRKFNRIVIRKRSRA